MLRPDPDGPVEARLALLPNNCPARLGAEGVDRQLGEPPADDDLPRLAPSELLPDGVLCTTTGLGRDVRAELAGRCAARVAVCGWPLAAVRERA